MIKRLNQWISDLFEKHKLVRRALVVFAMGLVGWTTGILYLNLELISTAIVSLHTITVGILSMAVGKYFVDREREDSRKPNSKGDNDE